MLDNAHIQAIRKSLSDPRLSPFLQHTGGDIRAALRLYEENIRKASNLWPAIHLAEVTLRNHTHKILINIWGADWPTNRRCKLQKIEKDRLNNTIKELKSKKKSFNTDNIIAEISLGFWVSLYTRRYDAPGYELWRKHLYQVFPNMPKRSRRRVSRRLQKLRHIRNRIAHHDNIIKYEEARILQTCHDILFWMCPHTAEWARQMGILPPDLEPPQSS